MQVISAFFFEDDPLFWRKYSINMSSAV